MTLRILRVNTMPSRGHHIYGKICSLNQPNSRYVMLCEANHMMLLALYTYHHNIQTQGWGQIYFIKYKRKYDVVDFFKNKYDALKNIKYKYKYSLSNTNTNTIYLKISSLKSSLFNHMHTYTFVS